MIALVAIVIVIGVFLYIRSRRRPFVPRPLTPIVELAPPPYVITSQSTIHSALRSQHQNPNPSVTISIFPTSQSFHGLPRIPEVKEPRIRRHSFSGSSSPKKERHARFALPKKSVTGHQSLSPTPRNSDSPNSVMTSISMNFEVKSHFSSSSFHIKERKSYSQSPKNLPRKSSPRGSSPIDSSPPRLSRNALRPSDKEFKFQLEKPKGFENLVQDYVNNLAMHEGNLHVLKKWPLKNTLKEFECEAKEIQQLEENAKKLIVYMNEKKGIPSESFTQSSQKSEYKEEYQEEEKETYEDKNLMIRALNLSYKLTHQTEQLRQIATELQNYVKETEKEQEPQIATLPSL